MVSKFIATTLLTTALMTGLASAQTNTGNKDTASATLHKEGEWRASKLAGVDVYNEANEKIGDINDVILDKSGKAEKVILGVGGFLGMGEHYVAVPFEKIKWVNEPVRSTTASKSRMVKKLRLLKGGSVPTFVGLGPVLHNKLAVDA